MDSAAHITQNQNGMPRMMMMAPDDEYGTSYTKPAKPAVKILRRPTQQSSETKSMELRPKQPIKTLQQREQEYAEARLRILGSAKNPEDDLEASISKVVCHKDDPDDNCQNRRIISDTIPCSTILNGQIRPCDNIIRLPRGPDGTSGFNIRR